LIEENKNAITQVDSNFAALIKLNNSRSIDTVSERMISHHLNFDLRVTHPNIARYEGQFATQNIQLDIEDYNKAEQQAKKIIALIVE
jgi:hypothetical protein